MQRRQLIHEEVKKISLSENLSQDALSLKVETAIEDWWEIPEDKITLCCKLARKKRPTVKNFHVLQEWNEMKGQRETPGIGGNDFNGVFIKAGTYYTIMTLPHVFWSNEMLSLRNKKHDKALTPQEEYEWDQLRETKWNALTTKPHRDAIERAKKCYRKWQEVGGKLTDGIG